MINDVLLNSYTFVYEDSTITQYQFNSNQEIKNVIVYNIDSTGKVYSYGYRYPDSTISTSYMLYYSANEFPTDYIVVGYTVLFIDNDGENMISMKDNEYYVYYYFDNVINTVPVPYESKVDITPSFIGVFGKENKHLLSGYYQTCAGPGVSIKNYDFE